MSTMASSCETEELYLPKRSKSVPAILFLTGIGAFVWIGLARDLVGFIHAGALPPAAWFFWALCGSTSLGFGLLVLAGAVFGFPRLTLTREGIEIRSVWKTCWANWSSLGAATVTVTELGRARRRIKFGTAEIIGEDCSGNLRRSRKLTVPNSFEPPIEEIITRINTRRAEILGDSPAPVTRVTHIKNEYGVPGFRMAWLTLVILGVLVVVFAAEAVFSVPPLGPGLQPGTSSLAILGGLNRTLVLSGEWYRLFTAPLLHAGIVHLVGNGIALLLIGLSLEKLVGRSWFLAFFVAGALGGSVASMAVNPPTMISVGASGGIMGLLAAGFASSFRMETLTRARMRLQSRSVQLLIPALLPLATSRSSLHIDYAAHAGGALAGAAFGLLVLRSWPKAEPLPRFRGMATGVALAAVLLLGLSGIAVAKHYPGYRAMAANVRHSPSPVAPERSADAGERPRAGCLASRGDSIEAVKQRYGLTSDPQKLDRVTPGGTAFQYHFDREGIWVFFDERMRVLSLRFDAPFQAAIYDVSVGDADNRLQTVKGLPAVQFQGFPVLASPPAAGPKFTTAWVYNPGMPSFARYDVFDGKVRSIIVNSCPS